MAINYQEAFLMKQGFSDGIPMVPGAGESITGSPSAGTRPRPEVPDTPTPPVCEDPRHDP
ncbi:hypothetical protein [Streptomyces sp. ST2-7A]|uniref:hypothetical protein n=1 Tax=Streptomyces sp. ST2-7A TaxID=2907214 RepID=UPI001F46C044|nr:hypothetical protein [Streptomyces sp. ST2-7A]MCE7079672.1 hypothetical protein [Streptomyces sp. ST2-7A]